MQPLGAVPECLWYAILEGQMHNQPRYRQGGSADKNMSRFDRQLIVKGGF